MNQHYYTKGEEHLLDIDYNKIQEFDVDSEEYPNGIFNYVKILYEGLVFDCEKKEFVNPKDLGCTGYRVAKYGKFIECHWIELEESPEEFMQQMHEDLNTLQRELDKERGVN